MSVIATTPRELREGNADLRLPKRLKNYKRVLSKQMIEIAKFKGLEYMENPVAYAVGKPPISCGDLLVQVDKVSYVAFVFDRRLFSQKIGKDGLKLAWSNKVSQIYATLEVAGLPVVKVCVMFESADPASWARARKNIMTDGHFDLTRWGRKCIGYSKMKLDDFGF